MMDRFEDSVTIQDNSDSLLSNKGTNHIKPQEEQSDNYEESFLNMCREIAQKNQNEKKDENIEKQMDELERECNSSRRSISEEQEPKLVPKNCFDPLYEKVVKNRQELLQENERGDKMFKPNPEWNNYQEIQQREEENSRNLIQKEDVNKKQQEQREQKGQNEQQKQKEQKNEIQQRGQKKLKSLELTEEQKLEQKFRDSLKNHYEKQKGIRKVRRTIVDQVFYEDPETKQLDKKTKRVIIEQDSKKKHLRKCVKKIQQMLRKIINLYE